MKDMDAYPQDSQITSSQEIHSGILTSNVTDISVLVQTMNNTAENIKNKEDKDNEKCPNFKKAFPWLKTFHKLCRTAVGNCNFKFLLKVMNVYIQNVSGDVESSYTRPLRAFTLKKSLNETLKCFHWLYLSLGKNTEHNIYLDKMTDLVAMYMDMEIKASRRSKENMKKITSKLITALYVLLHSSLDHILESVLKAKFFKKCFNEICIPILKRVLSSLKSGVNEMTYVRCVILFKLWKQLVREPEEKSQVNKIAFALMPPPGFEEMVSSGILSNVFPPIPRNRRATRVTRFLITKKFNLANSMKAFLKISRDPKYNNVTTTFDKPRFFGECENDFAETLNPLPGDKDLLMDNIWETLLHLENLRGLSTDDEKEKKEIVPTVKMKKRKKDEKIGKTKKKKKETQYAPEIQELLHKMKIDSANKKINGFGINNTAVNLVPSTNSDLPQRNADVLPTFNLMLDKKAYDIYVYEKYKNNNGHIAFKKQVDKNEITVNSQIISKVNSKLDQNSNETEMVEQTENNVMNCKIGTKNIPHSIVANEIPSNSCVKAKNDMKATESVANEKSALTQKMKEICDLLKNKSNSEDNLAELFEKLSRELLNDNPTTSSNSEETVSKGTNISSNNGEDEAAIPLVSEVVNTENSQNTQSENLNNVRDKAIKSSCAGIDKQIERLCLTETSTDSKKELANIMNISSESDCKRLGLTSDKEFNEDSKITEIETQCLSASKEIKCNQNLVLNSPVVPHVETQCLSTTKEVKFTPDLVLKSPVVAPHRNTSFMVEDIIGPTKSSNDKSVCVTSGVKVPQTNLQAPGEIISPTDPITSHQIDIPSLDITKTFAPNQFYLPHPITVPISLSHNVNQLNKEINFDLMVENYPVKNKVVASDLKINGLEYASFLSQSANQSVKNIHTDSTIKSDNVKNKIITPDFKINGFDQISNNGASLCYNVNQFVANGIKNEAIQNRVVTSHDGFSHQSYNNSLLPHKEADTNLKIKNDVIQNMVPPHLTINGFAIPSHNNPPLSHSVDHLVQETHTDLIIKNRAVTTHLNITGLDLPNPLSHNFNQSVKEMYSDPMVKNEILESKIVTSDLKTNRLEASTTLSENINQLVKDKCTDLMGINYAIENKVTSELKIEVFPEMNTINSPGQNGISNVLLPIENEPKAASSTEKNLDEIVPLSRKTEANEEKVVTSSSKTEVFEEEIVPVSSKTNEIEENVVSSLSTMDTIEENIVSSLSKVDRIEEKMVSSSSNIIKIKETSSNNINKMQEQFSNNTKKIEEIFVPLSNNTNKSKEKIVPSSSKVDRNVDKTTSPISKSKNSVEKNIKVSNKTNKSEDIVLPSSVPAEQIEEKDVQILNKVANSGNKVVPSLKTTARIEEKSNSSVSKLNKNGDKIISSSYTTSKSEEKLVISLSKSNKNMEKNVPSFKANEKTVQPPHKMTRNTDKIAPISIAQIKEKSSNKNEDKIIPLEFSSKKQGVSNESSRSEKRDHKSKANAHHRADHSDVNKNNEPTKVLKSESIPSKRRSSKSKSRSSDFSDNWSYSRGFDDDLNSDTHVEYICTTEPNASSDSLKMKIQRCTVKDINKLIEKAQNKVEVKNDAAVVDNKDTSSDFQKPNCNNIPKNISEKVYVKTGKKNGVTKLVQLPMKNAVYIDIKNDVKLRKEVQVKLHKLNDDDSNDLEKVENKVIPEKTNVTTTNNSKTLSTLVNNSNVSSNVTSKSPIKDKNVGEETNSKQRKLALKHSNEEDKPKIITSKSDEHLRCIGNKITKDTTSKCERTPSTKCKIKVTEESIRNFSNLSYNLRDDSRSKLNHDSKFVKLSDLVMKTNDDSDQKEKTQSHKVQNSNSKVSAKLNNTTQEKQNNSNINIVDQNFKENKNIIDSRKCVVDNSFTDYGNQIKEEDLTRRDCSKCSKTTLNTSNYLQSNGSKFNSESNLEKESVPNTYQNQDRTIMSNHMFTNEVGLTLKEKFPKGVAFSPMDQSVQNLEQIKTEYSLTNCNYQQISEVDLSKNVTHPPLEYNMVTDGSTMPNQLYSQPNGEIPNLSSKNECSLPVFSSQLNQFVCKDNLMYRMTDSDSLNKISAESAFKASNLNINYDGAKNPSDTYMSEEKCGQLPSNDLSALCLVVDKSIPKEDDFEMDLCGVAQEIEVCSVPETYGTVWGYTQLPEEQNRDCGDVWHSRVGLDEELIMDNNGSHNFTQGMFTTADNDVFMPSVDTSLKRKRDDFERIKNDLLTLQAITYDISNCLVECKDPEKSNLHLRTVDNDYAMCNKQHEFKDYYLSPSDVPLSIPVPYPPQIPPDNFRSLVRCPCPLCCKNRCILLNNFNILTQYKNAKVKLQLDLKPNLDDKEHYVEQDCSLPLKKRKTLTHPKLEEVEIPSYPSTPMISIAELELTNYKPTARVIVPNPQTQPLPNAVGDIYLPSNYSPDRNGWRFKTPTQMKEHSSPTNDVTVAARNLINFSQSTFRKYMNDEDLHPHKRQSKRHKQSMRKPGDVGRFWG